ncbi:MAG: hypothetical protein ABIV10_12825 [Gemmatimonadaceae bacterium]
MTRRSIGSRWLILVLSAVQIALPGVAALADASIERESAARGVVAAHIETRTGGACARIHPAECALCQAACASFVRPDAQPLASAPRRTTAAGTLVVRSRAADAGSGGESRPRAPPAMS